MNFADVTTCRRATGVAAIVTLIFAGTILAQQSHTLTGDIRVHKSFHSKILNNDRDVVVYLPPGYESNKNKRYGVLYLHDGQNLFDGATSFIPGKEWRVDETAQSLITAGKIEPLIVVGIYNDGKARIDEYTPVADEKYKMGGKADLYGRMLVEELKPFIDATYRTGTMLSTQVWVALLWGNCFYLSGTEIPRPVWPCCRSIAFDMVCQ